MLPDQTPRTGPIESTQDRFQALCSELEEYEHLPELAPGTIHPAQFLTCQKPEETLDESILAGLTLP